METEIWPNLIHEAKRRGARVAMVNGRISPRSYPRYRRLRALLGRVLAEVDLFLMQGEAHRSRLVAMGAPAERVRVSGNLKYDALQAPVTPEPLRRALGQEGPAPPPLLVAGSTLEGEEAAVLDAFAALRRARPDARLVIAARRPERFAAVAEQAASAGWRVARRTALPEGGWRDGDVLVLDTVGELAQVYPLATVVFVGGSLVPAGGHNVLEPAVAGKPIVVGPHMENFQEIAAAFLAEDAMIQVRDGAGLAAAVGALFADAGAAGRPRPAGEGRGGAQPRRARAHGGRAGGAGLVSARALLAPLGSAFGAAAALRARLYARGTLGRESLAGPVISVGNLAVGGRGKTPLVARVASIVAGAGPRVAILSRGYGGSASGAVLVSDGTAVLAGADVAGDEPVALARALPGVVVAVARRRVEAGRLVESALRPLRARARRRLPAPRPRPRPRPRERDRRRPLRPAAARGRPARASLGAGPRGRRPPRGLAARRRCRTGWMPRARCAGSAGRSGSRRGRRAGGGPAARVPARRHRRPGAARRRRRAARA